MRRIEKIYSIWTFALLWAFLVALLPSCIGSKRIDPAVNFNASYTQTIKTIEASREEAVRTLGEAMERGISINEQTVREIDGRAKVAIDVAKEALATYIEAGGTKAGVFSAMSALNAVMVELMAEVTTARLGVP